MFKTLSIIPLFLVSLAFADCGKHDDLGLPSTDGVSLCRIGYQVDYNTLTKVPNWVGYYMDYETVSPSLERVDTFRHDPELSIYEQATIADYRRSGYDRSHLFPNASADFSLEAQAESFLMTNIAPQVPGLNRQGWAELETHFRNCAKGEQKGINVFTGPIYDDLHYSIIGQRVRVPDAFFKVAASRSEPYQVAAYIMPNRTVRRSDIAKYRVTVDEVERLTGFDLFKAIPWIYSDKQEASASGLCDRHSRPFEEPDVADTSTLLQNMKAVDVSDL